MQSHSCDLVAHGLRAQASQAPSERWASHFTSWRNRSTQRVLADFQRRCLTSAADRSIEPRVFEGLWTFWGGLLDMDGWEVVVFWLRVPFKKVGARFEGQSEEAKGTDTWTELEMNIPTPFKMELGETLHPP